MCLKFDCDSEKFVIRIEGEIVDSWEESDGKIFNTCEQENLIKKVYSEKKTNRKMLFITQIQMKSSLLNNDAVLWIYFNS